VRFLSGERDFAQALADGGLLCAQPSDCQSGVCAGGVCQAPTCFDTVQNGGESDVDCGGTMCGAQLPQLGDCLCHAGECRWMD